MGFCIAQKSHHIFPIFLIFCHFSRFFEILFIIGISDNNSIFYYRGLKLESCNNVKLVCTVICTHWVVSLISISVEKPLLEYWDERKIFLILCPKLIILVSTRTSYVSIG